MITGTVGVTFIAPDGTVTTASLGAGNSLTLDNTLTFTVTASSSNSDSVAIVINGVPITLPPNGSVSTVDTDRDGVNNTIDQCPGTRARDLVNGVGCSIDNDGDRITNDVDVQPNTGSLDASDRINFLGGITDITIENHGSSLSFSCFILNGGPDTAVTFGVDFDARARACVLFGRVHKVSDELPNITNSQLGPRGIRLWITRGDGDGLRDDWVQLRCDSPLCLREWNGKVYPTRYTVPDFHFVVDLIDHDNDPATPPRKVSRKVIGDLHMVIAATFSNLTTVEEGSVEVSVGTGDDIIVFTVTASEGGAAGGLHLENAEDGTLIATNEGEAGSPPITFTIDDVEVGSLNPGDPPLRIVSVDIKPGSHINRINTRSKGVIPVAILTTDSFDATTVDVSTVEFGPGGATIAHKKAHLEDVDGDGDIDLVMHFRTQDAGISAGDEQACLTGVADGSNFIGCDVVTVK